MDTKYGVVSNAKFKNDMNSLGNRVYKLLPMKEESQECGYVSTIDANIISIINEINSLIEILPDDFYGCNLLFTVIRNLNGLIGEEDHGKFRSKILKSRGLISKVGDCNVR